MSLSAIIMAIIGISASFLPHEILSYLGLPTTQLIALLFQVMGAMYFAFAMINWFARSNLIGGIYSKPIALGNFAHFAIASLALVKGIDFDSSSHTLWVIAAIYIIFAMLFGYIAFGNSIKRDEAI